MSDTDTKNDAGSGPAFTPPDVSGAIGARGAPKYLVDGLQLTGVRNGVSRFFAFRDDLVPADGGAPAQYLRQYLFQIDMDIPTVLSLSVFLESFAEDLIRQGMVDQEEYKRLKSAPSIFSSTNG